MMNNNKHPESIFNTRHFQMVMNILMVSVMLTCFSALIGNSIAVFYPEWGSHWFPVITFIITFSSMLMRYARQFTYTTRPNPLKFSLVETVLILVMAKTVSVLYTVPLNWTSIWQEITSWSQNFLENFTSSDFLLRAFSLMVIWLLAMLFSAPLNQLQEDEVLMEQEKMGYTFNDRYVARRKLIALVFNPGFVMIIVMVILNSNLPAIPEDTIPTTNSVVILILYFFTAFIFLAFNQYAIMKARWYFGNIKVSPDLLKRWILFSFLFVFLVILVIVFLPTGFAIEIPALAQWVVDAIIFIASFIYSIIISPFLFLMLLIRRLSNDEAASEPIQETAPELPELLPQSISAMPWWDVVRSLIFWLVFIAIIVFAISYFILNKPSLKQFFKDMRIFGWIKELWKWLIQGLKQAHRATAETLQNSFTKIQNFIQRQQLKTPNFLALSKRMPPRLAVILIYIDWTNWNQKHGFNRNASQTPLEYAKLLKQIWQDTVELHDSVDQLTEVFIQARYSSQPVIKEQVDEAQHLSNDLKLAFHVQQDPQESPS